MNDWTQTIRSIERIAFGVRGVRNRQATGGGAAPVGPQRGMTRLFGTTSSVTWRTFQTFQRMEGAADDLEGTVTDEQQRKADRYHAFVSLLAQPDLPCLPPRGFCYTQPGSDTRRKWIMRRDLGRAYLEYRMLEASRFESEVISVRRVRLQLVEGKRGLPRSRVLLSGT